jgi:hypothetical protein
MFICYLLETISSSFLYYFLAVRGSLLPAATKTRAPECGVPRISVSFVFFLIG